MQMPANDVTDRVVLVTGAARGMGAAMVEGLLKDGAKVVALDLSWGQVNSVWTEAGSFREQLGSNYPDRVLTVEADVTNDAALDSAYEETLNRFGRLDAVVNNAALLQHHLFPPHGRTNALDASDEAWEKMMSVNVLGVVKVLRRFVQPLKEGRGGSIVNMVTGGTVPGRYRPGSQEQPYMASKAAIVSLSVYLAHELAEFNIAVNSVNPGHAEMTGWAAVDKARAEKGIPTPSSRLVPEHIVPLITFLVARDATNGPTGEMLSANEWNLQHGYGTPEDWRRENWDAQRP